MSDVRESFTIKGSVSSGNWPSRHDPGALDWAARRRRHGRARATTRSLAKACAALRSRRARWVGLGLVLGAGVALRVTALAYQPAPDSPEAALVTQVVEVTRLVMNGAGGTTGVPISAASLQLSLLCAALGSWGWAPSVLDAVRGLGLPLWLVASAQVWLLARRLGAGRGTAGVAVAALAVSPMAIEASERAIPQNVAAIWALAALLVALPARQTDPRQTDPLAEPEWRWHRSGLLVGTCLGIAVITAPMLLALVPVAVLLLARRADAWRAVALCALGLTVTVAGALMLGVSPTAGQPTWFAPGWMHADPVTPLLGVVVGLAAVSHLRWRETAIGLVAVSVVSCCQGVPGALVWPFAVALGAAVLTDWHTRVPRSRPEAAALRGWTPGSPILRLRAHREAVSLVGIAALAWSVSTAVPSWPATTPVVSARGWITGNLWPDQPIRADLSARVALASGLTDWDRYVTDDGCRIRWRAGCSSPWWVGQPSSPGHGVLIARFGRPEQRGGLEVRTQEPQPLDPAAELRSRQVAGSVLATSPALAMAPPLAAQLRAGLLDPRACTALGALAGDQRIRLVALSAVPGDVDPTLRQLVIAPDGPAPSGDTTHDGELRSITAFFQAQLLPFRPFAMAATPGGVEVRYSPYAPPGLLAAFLPPA
ncbi:MAG TPA: hypothetical protein VFE65_06070 [Pseudonocardia sp.]|nr:hypothetical protein [Pseudonocardia sp.]